MKKVFSILAVTFLALSSCNSEPSLEKYFVEKSEDKNFLQADVSPSILKLDETKLSDNEKVALKSFDKMNVLAFKLNAINKNVFDKEKNNVATILKDKKYQELMKIGSGKQGAQIIYVGDDEHISEFVVYGKSNESGFAVIRILGKNMNPTSILTMLSILKNSKIDLEQLKPLKDLIK